MLGVPNTEPELTALSTVQSRTEGFVLILAALTMLSCYTAISGLVKAELFPANVRALGVVVLAKAASYEAAFRLFGFITAPTRHQVAAGV